MTIMPVWEHRCADKHAPAYLMIAFMTSMALATEQTKGSQAWSGATVTVSTLWVRTGGKQPDAECKARQLNALQLWAFVEK